MCVTASGNEVFLITLKLEVTQGMSLRALVDCGASNNFVRRQSLDNRELENFERKIPPTRMTPPRDRRIRNSGEMCSGYYLYTEGSPI